MRNKIIDKWMLLLMAVLITACSGNNEENNGSSDEEDCFLEIYVYAPGRPIVTRGDEGEIDPTDDESKVTSLKIWVFKYADGTPVGYLEADPSLLSATTPRKYLMKLDRDFVKNPTNVDVYVVANAESDNAENPLLTTTNGTPISLDGQTTRSQLNDAVIASNHFGIGTPLVSEVPANGLPMSAVLRNQPIFGSFPTLHVGEDNKMATLELTRAVSKLRFVLCRIKEAESTSKKFVSIDGIKLNGNQIPTTSYLMPGTYNYSNYESGAITFEDDDPGKIPQVVNPLVYTYGTQAAQDYENLIDAAVKSDLDKLKAYGQANNIDELKNLTADDLPQLKQLGLTYLRESDKQLAGVINYTYKEKEGDNEVQVQATADFTMAAPGDFLRNHSWIVYVYYMDSKIHVLTVVRIGMKEWVSDGQPESPWFYNW